MYILDTVAEVYMWIGSGATRIKTAKALDLASKMKTEHGCAVPVQVLGMHYYCIITVILHY